MNRTLSFAAFGLAMLCLSQPAASAETLRLLSGWGPNDKVTFSPVQAFQDNVAKVSGGELTVVVSGPEAVSPFEQLEPVSAGVFDMLYTHGAYHLGSQGLAVTADAFGGDPAKVRSSGIWDYLDAYYQENHDLKLLALTGVGSHGYHCYMRQAPEPSGDWAGRRMRGVAVFHGVIETLGGVPVVMPIGEIYSSLERGVIDGACAPAAGMLANKHFEVAKVRIEPTFGQSVAMIAINLERWNELTPEQQAMLAEAGALTEQETPAIGDAHLAEERAALAAAGVTVFTMPADKAALVDTTFRDSVWKLGTDCCGQSAEELRALARAADLSN